METPSADRRRAGLATWLLFATITLLGVAVIAVLPPWEGFDETAHWSSIQEISDLGKVPAYGDKLSIDRLAYFGPEPRNIDQRGRSYGALRAHPPVTGAGGPGRYRADRLDNWQTQHPPLYYALMAPLYWAAHGLGWVDHLLVLRLGSWAMALGGLVLGTLAIRRASLGATSGLTDWTAPKSLLWPILFAGFFADLARLGNDSLCLLIFGAMWWLLLPMLDEEADTPAGQPISATAIGLLLGAGLWTKAFFAPISVGVGALLIVRALRARSPRRAIDAALAIGLGWAIGAGWYLTKLATTGSLSGSEEAIELAHAGGLLHGLMLHHNPVSLFRSLAVAVATLGWTSTWSLVRLPEIFLLPVSALLAVIVWGYAAELGSNRRLIVWAPATVALPFAAALGWHAVVRLAIDGSGAGTPGWYLHVIAPALGLMLAIGVRNPLILAILGGFSLIATGASWTAELSYFSGCVGANAAGHYDLARAVCFIEPVALSRLGHPGLGLFAALGAAAAGVAAAMLAWRPVAATLGAAHEIELIN
jgi:hypothetical protein